MNAERQTMRAVAIERFGGIEEMKVMTLPIPEAGPDEVLIRVECAGIGEWDPFEREGGFAEMLDMQPTFPYVLGSDGAGTVVAAGSNVTGLKTGDRVYAVSLASPKGGFYAEYAATLIENTALVPDKLPIDQAGVMPVDAVTALRGIDDTLELKRGDFLMIFGASGGVGHLALQFAKRIGARVLAVASRDDGVALARKLGADAVVEGHKDDVAAAVRQFAPDGLDAALLTAGGETAEQALKQMRRGGRVAYPNGVEPEPAERPDISVESYDGTPDRQVFERLNSLIEAGPFEVHIARAFTFDQVAEAHRALENHHIGKLALKPG